MKNLEYDAPDWDEESMSFYCTICGEPQSICTCELECVQEESEFCDVT